MQSIIILIKSLIEDTLSEQSDRSKTSTQKKRPTLSSGLVGMVEKFCLTLEFKTVYRMVNCQQLSVIIALVQTKSSSSTN